MGQGGPQDQHGAAQVDAQHAVEHGQVEGVEIDQVGRVEDAGAGDDAVQRPEALDRGGQGRVDRGPRP